MDRDYWTFLTVCAIGGLVLSLVAVWQGERHTTAEPTEPMLLQVHHVPPVRAGDIRIALEKSLSMGDGQLPLGRVSTTGLEGQLLVLAPESVQEDIEQAIVALGGSAGPGAPDSGDTTIEFDLWLIDAIPGESADDPALAPIAAALDGARKALGAVRFERRDALSVATRTGSGNFNARTAGGFSVGGAVQPRDGGVIAELMLVNPTMSTTLNLRFNEPLVLARIAGEEGRTHVLVARVRPVDASA